MKSAAGIVTFNPDQERIKENIGSVLQQCSHLYIVDNGSSIFDELYKLSEHFTKGKITFIKNNKNEGIAKALNQLCSAAYSDGYNWLLTLDQDSVCPSNMLGEYLKYTDNNDVGIICTALNDRNMEIKKSEVETQYINSCITSGSFVRLEAWKAVDGFDEVMFIDGVDFDFCDRIIKVGYKILRLNKVVLLHEIGRITKRKFLFWNVYVKNHSAFRKYYISRNIVYLEKKRRTRFGSIVAFLKVVKQYGLVLLYEDQKKEKLEAIIKGYRDGKILKIV